MPPLTIPSLPTFPNEEVKEISGLLGYCISSTGRLFSCWGPQGIGKWRQRVGQQSRNGKHFIRVEGKNYLLEALVLTAFIGPKPAGAEPIHRDGNLKNCFLDNLYWGKQRQPSLPSLSHCAIRILDQFPGYAVTDNGEIWSCRSSSHGTHFEKEWKKLTPKDHGGRRIYLEVILRDLKGKRKHRTIHSLVLEGFVGPCPAQMEACHNNGHHRDNLLSNLRWDTPSSNMQDRNLHGTYQGENTHLAKLKETEVKQILVRYSQGEKIVSIAKDFPNVNRSNISHITSGKTWKHVKYLPILA